MDTSARSIERSTRHKENPNCPILGSRAALLEAGVLTDELTKVRLERTLACMLTGDHEWDEQTYQLEPDPYGRWVVGGNYVTRVPEYARFQALEGALRT